MKTIVFSIPNISCNHCVNTIRSELSEVEGVSKVDAYVDQKQAVVSFENPASEEGLRAVLTNINYPAA